MQRSCSCIASSQDHARKAGRHEIIGKYQKEKNTYNTSYSVGFTPSNNFEKRILFLNVSYCTDHYSCSWVLEFQTVRFADLKLSSPQESAVDVGLVW